MTTPLRKTSDHMSAPSSSYHAEDLEFIQHEHVWPLPRVRGRYYFSYALSKITWFQVGGVADVLFKPCDPDDLSDFLRDRDPSMPITILGAGSNVLIRDGGIKGCVIKLGKEFSTMTFDVDANEATVGAACLDRTFVLECAKRGLSGLEFLVGVPGTIGGAVAMNAGAYHHEIKEFLKWIDVIFPDGDIVRLDRSDLNMSYRSGNLPPHAVVIRACFSLVPQDPEIIYEKINENLIKREESQPVKGRTGGSTFKNPSDDVRAWQLIDTSGCRGMTLNHAQISQKHCNFMLNTNQASAQDLELLGEKVRVKVLEKTGILLEWEIIRMGEMKADSQELHAFSKTILNTIEAEQDKKSS